ncbi:hypothetical protein C0585_01250 [Candidatus Woesearchaeota archaeon]|nr:MAG: hypothetical protein C0585_01250 [Candidatus Woesearchaeota archaeon]
MKIPKLKKKITNFLIKEDGKITKEHLIKTGIILTTLSLATQSSDADGTTHQNSMQIHNDGDGATGTHSHHVSHSSY